MKENFLRIIAGLAFPIVFIGVFFLFGGGNCETTGWMGFALILVSYMIFIATPIFLPQSDSSYLFGMTTGKLTALFFAVCSIFGLFFILVDFKNWKIAIVLVLFLFAAFIVSFSYLILTDKRTADLENKQKSDAYDVKVLVSKAKIIMGRAVNYETKKQIQRVCSELESCPTNSNPAVKAIDDSIAYQLEILNQAVMTNNQVQVINAVNMIHSLSSERKQMSRNY